MQQQQQVQPGNWGVGVHPAEVLEPSRVAELGTAFFQPLLQDQERVATPVEPRGTAPPPVHTWDDPQYPGHTTPLFLSDWANKWLRENGLL